MNQKMDVLSKLASQRTVTLDIQCQLEKLKLRRGNLS